MAKVTTTVTHPDSTVSKRSSVRANYTHAVVVGPVDPAVRAAYLRQQAAEADAEIVEIAEALKDPRVSVRSRGFRLDDPTSYHTHEAFLVGPRTNHRGTARVHGSNSYPTFSEHCNSEGIVEAYAHDEDGSLMKDSNGEYIRFETSAKNDLVLAAWHKIASLMDFAVDARTKADRADAGDQGPKGTGYSVVRWSTRRDLAAKAADGEFAYFAAHGHQVSVVEVDAK